MAVRVDDGELIRRALDSRLQDVWTCFPARVVAYDATTQTADLEPQVRRPIPNDDGDIIGEDLPVLPNVPITFPRGGGDTYAITWKLQANDFVWVHVCTNAIGNWRSTGEVSDPGDVRNHSLGNCFAVPGAAPTSMALAQANDPDGAMVFEAPQFKIGKDASDYAALSSLVMNNLNAIKETLASGTTASTGGPVTFSVPFNPQDVKASKTRIK